MSQPERSLLSFMIGPVQPFIESARTLRDLWSGSYLLSWLTAAAMQPVIDESDCGYQAFVTPHVDAQNPLLAAMRGQSRGDQQATLPSLPNKFAAVVPSEKVNTLREACIKAVRDEWQRICRAVHGALDETHQRLKITAGWDLNWDGQLADFFEIRVVARAIGSTAGDSARWSDDWNQLGALMEMARSVRHVPNYTAKESPDGRFPGKCSLLGTLEQMGPASLSESKKYWEKLASSNGISGTRIQGSDRLCAVSLVKRFAWPAYFSNANREKAGRLGCDVQALRFSDTATIAANLWLADGQSLLPFNSATQRWAREWSGQWLHWAAQTSGDEKCPDQTWREIQEKKKDQGTPPTYYAILHMDGDNMGLLFQGSDASGWGQGQTRYREITRRMTEYSLKHVEGIVEQYSGELIYAGGDDVLAVLPTSTVIACANSLRRLFSSPEVLGTTATASAGIAVVHYKEDLRFALDVARRAEKAAKRIGKNAQLNPTRPDDPPRKDALAITVCRHSGEHSTGVMSWKHSEMLGQLVQDYRGSSPPSDRWAYKLRDELSILQGLPKEAVKTELRRLLKRTESAADGFRDRVESLFEGYEQEMTRSDRGWNGSAVLDGFTTICQTASFLARGRE